MKLDRAADLFIADYEAEGRINSPHTRLAYRQKLQHLADTTGNRDPAKIGPADIKQALSRWTGNSRVQAHAIYQSFFKWCQWEGIRTTNPAEQVRPTKRRAPEVVHLTRDEVITLLETSKQKDRRRDKWVAHFGVCAGLRSQELRGLQGRHLLRDGWIHVDAAIAKGGRERWVPVLTDLEPIVAEVLTFTDVDAYVLPGRVNLGAPNVTMHREDPHKRLSPSALYKQCVALGERAGLGQRVTPHVLRRAFAEHVARSAGLRVAQALMGHASVETTTQYTDRPSLDELAVSVQGFSFYSQLSPQKEAQTPHDS